MKKEDYKVALIETRKLFRDLQTENYNLRETLKYYADKKNMRDIQLIDQGQKAQTALERI